MLKKNKKIQISVLSLYFRYGTRLKYAKIFKDPDDYNDYAIVDDKGEAVCYHMDEPVIESVEPGKITFETHYMRRFSLSPEELACAMVYTGELVKLGFDDLIRTSPAARNVSDGTKMLQLSDRNAILIRNSNFDTNEGCEFPSYALWLASLGEAFELDMACPGRFMVTGFGEDEGCAIRVRDVGNPKIALSLSPSEAVTLLGLDRGQE